MNITRIIPLLTLMCINNFTSFAQSVGNPQKGSNYLYCHMSGRGQWTAYAVSRDGVVFHDLIGGDSVFSSKALAGIEGGTRDAYICRKHDMSGYLMVTTDMNNAATKRLGKKNTWDNYGINLYIRTGQL